MLSSLRASLIRPAAPRRRPAASRPRRLILESLEDRWAPAVVTWTGAASNSLGPTLATWAGGVVPADADQVVFPAGAGHQSNVNDLVNLSLHSIWFQGGGYRVDGNPVAVSGLTGVVNVAGSNTVAL